jgi:putative transposase
MPRPPRFFAPGVPVHVIHRGNNRDRIFFVASDRPQFAALLRTAAADHGLAVHAYVLMDNHIHLLATPESETSLPAAMKRLGVRYGAWINRTHGRTGTLWEGRYRACLIDSDRYLLACMRYIELNPVRAGMAAAPAAFRWSSHRANTLGEADPLVTPHPILRDLGANGPERRAAYRALFHEPTPDDVLDAVRTATQHGWPLGSDAFAATVARSTGASARPRRRYALRPLRV